MAGKKSFKLKEVKPNIFCLEFNNDYDMCMFFLRYQEYYESPSPRFRGRAFKILDFMRWYSAEFGEGAFTYPIDWSGFNLPPYVITKVLNLGIPDPNDYDHQMWKVYEQCEGKADGKFYIIGVSKEGSEPTTLHHEMAHAFFYLRPAYKKQMSKLVKELAPDVHGTMINYLTKLGYPPKVFVDEIQANMATPEDFATSAPKHWTLEMAAKLTEAQKPFIEVFRTAFGE
jgi:hypothetical protein